MFREGIENVLVVKLRVGHWRAIVNVAMDDRGVFRGCCSNSLHSRHTPILARSMLSVIQARCDMGSPHRQRGGDGRLNGTVAVPRCGSAAGG